MYITDQFSNECQAVNSLQLNILHILILHFFVSSAPLCEINWYYDDYNNADEVEQPIVS